MKVYISGKISGLPQDVVAKKFNAASECAILLLGTNNIVNPLKIRPLFGIKRWAFFMLADLRVQRTCHCTAFQHNWKDSRGAVIEYFFAKFIFKQRILFLKD